MTTRPWMPFYVADYLADTQHLATIEHGAYDLLIMHYWRHGALPDDDQRLAVITKMKPGEWRKHRPTLAAFFQEGWQHRRIDAEIAKADAKQKLRQEAGKRGGIAKALLQQKPSNALASSSQPESERKKDAADAAPGQEVDLFRRGKAILGDNAGGLISQLLAAKEKNIALARAAIEQASTKENPREYIGAIIRGAHDPPDRQKVDPRL